MDKVCKKLLAFGKLSFEKFTINKMHMGRSDTNLYKVEILIINVKKIFLFFLIEEEKCKKISEKNKSTMIKFKF